MQKEVFKKIKGIGKSVSSFVRKTKKQYPGVDWVNLFTGAGILILIVVFSVWYFERERVGGQADEVQNILPVVKKAKEEAKPKVSGVSSQEVEVQKGEGLWHVAQRVCGDTELYNYVALENGLSHKARLEVGQKLRVSCNYPVK